MNRSVKILSIIIIVFLAACNDSGIKIVKSEAWNNKMPGAEPKTHLLITASQPENNADFEIKEMTITNGEEKIKLQSHEINTELQEGNILVKAEFRSTDNNLKQISAVIKYRLGGNEDSVYVKDISIENVY